MATTVRQANLDTMLRLAERVVRGTCTAVQPSQILVQGRYLPVTRYAFKVTEALKGSADQEFILLQAGWPRAAAPTESGSFQALPSVVEGMPEYLVGEEYLLLLTRPSAVGLSSPVGLEQSAFRSIRGRDGVRRWRNGVDNRGLLEGMSDAGIRQFEAAGSPPSLESGLPYREFVEWVRQRSRELR